MGKAGKGADFVGEQAPIICQEWVTLARVFYTICAVIWIVILVNSIRMLNKSVNKDKNEWIVNDDHSFTWRFFRFVIGFVTFIASSLAISINTWNFCLVWFAPRVYILQQISELIKSFK